jgi:hypothetical protein
MIDTNELVLVTFGFQTVEDWKRDKHLGKLTVADLMKSLRYKSIEEWDAAIMPLHREVKIRIIAALGRLWQVIGKPVNKEQMQVYYHTFANYPPEVVEKGVEAIMKTHKYSNVPTLAELMEYAS